MLFRKAWQALIFDVFRMPQSPGEGMAFSPGLSIASRLAMTPDARGSGISGQSWPCGGDGGSARVMRRSSQPSHCASFASARALTLSST